MRVIIMLDAFKAAVNENIIQPLFGNPAQEQAAREQAAREQAAREQAEREQAEREQRIAKEEADFEQALKASEEQANFERQVFALQEGQEEQLLQQALRESSEWAEERKKWEQVAEDTERMRKLPGRGAKRPANAPAGEDDMPELEDPSKTNGHKRPKMPAPSAPPQDPAFGASQMGDLLNELDPKEQAPFDPYARVPAAIATQYEGDGGMQDDEDSVESIKAESDENTLPEVKRQGQNCVIS